MTRHLNGQFAQSRQALGVVTLVAAGAVIAACGEDSTVVEVIGSDADADPDANADGDSGRFMTALVERWSARIGAAVRRIARRAVRTGQEGTASHASRPL